MRILMLNYEFPRLGGGGGVVSSYLAAELAKRHTVDVITSHYKGLPYYEELGTIRIFRIPVLLRTNISTATLTSLVSYPVGALLQGIKLFRKQRYDVINTHFAIPTGPVGMLLSKMFKTPNVLSLHGGDIYDPTKSLSPHRQALLRFVVRRVLRSAGAIASNSTVVRQKAEFYYGVHGIDVVPLGMPKIEVVPLARSELGLAHDEVVFISIGRMIPRKGFSYLLKAFSRIPYEKKRLLLIGDGPERKQLEALSKELGIQERVSFLGSVFGEKKYHYLCAADVFVLSSVYEPFGMVLLEAMQCGLPIVATNCGGHSDFLRDGESGFSVPAADEHALADSLSLLIKEPQLKKKMGGFNKEYVKNFLIQNATQKYEQLFDRVVQRRAPVPAGAAVPRRVLMLNYEYPPLGGGAGNATFYLLKEFSRYRTVSIDVVTASLSGYQEYAVSDNIRVYCLDIGKNGNRPHYQTNKDLMLYLAKSYSFCRRLQTRYRYDLCHAFFGIPCGLIALRLGMPYIVSLRGSDVPFFNERFLFVDRILFRRLSRRIWSKAEKVIANSDELRALALKTNPQQEIHVIYNGVDTAEFSPGKRNHPRELVLISVGRLIQRKGFEFLIRALGGLDGVRLMLVGEGSLKEELQQLARHCNAAVEFIGRSDHETIISLLRQSDVFVMPSLNEGMSNALLEAMSCGLAVISTDTGGASGLIDGNGCIVRKRDSQAIRGCVEVFLNDRSLVEKMGERSRQIALRMSWRSMAEAYHAVYDSVLALCSTA